jgi:predicted nucleic-acid-binding protein
MAARATRFLADADELLLPDLILAEAVYVLESFYKVDRPRVAELARAVLVTPADKMLPEETVRESTRGTSLHPARQGVLHQTLAHGRAVLDNIKAALAFRRFSRRTRPAVLTKWELISLHTHLPKGDTTGDRSLGPTARHAHRRDRESPRT